MRYRRKEEAAVTLIAIIIVIAIVVALVSVVIIWPYLTRSDDYANDPNDPPEGVDPGVPPKWTGELFITAKVVGGKDYKQDWVINDVTVTQVVMDKQPWDGEPWESGSFLPEWFTPAPAHIDVRWEAKISRSSTTYEDDGTIKVYKDHDFLGFGDSGYFFFWEPQEGTWHYEVTVHAGPYSDTMEGTLTI